MTDPFLRRMYRGLFRHAEWNIGIVHSPIAAYLEADARPLVSWFPPAKRGRFLSDPFAVIRNGTVHVLCEEYDYAAGKGRIVSIELKDWRHPSKKRTAIELPIHTSYPYLLEHRGNIYCVPETHQAREVAIYKANQFPQEWIKCAPLISDFSGLDATVFQYEERWWLTCTSKDDGGPLPGCKKLFIWHAPELLGPWRPHSGNPVKIDISSSRPAGTPFMHAGYLYRPAQDCLRNYGGRIVINRVTRLTPSEFDEEPAAVIEPYANGPYPDGVHTISAAGDVTIIDGLRRRFDPSALRQNVTQALNDAKANIDR
jgi:hypothetical protein